MGEKSRKSSPPPNRRTEPSAVSAPRPTRELRHSSSARVGLLWLSPLLSGTQRERTLAQLRADWLRRAAPTNPGEKAAVCSAPAGVQSRCSRCELNCLCNLSAPKRLSEIISVLLLPRGGPYLFHELCLEGSMRTNNNNNYKQKEKTHLPLPPLLNSWRARLDDLLQTMQIIYCAKHGICNMICSCLQCAMGGTCAF